MASSISDVIKPLSWLIGKWNSTSAKGQYPTIKPFEYTEELEFSSYGQPMLQYNSKTYMGEEKKPKHFESGFLRIKPGTNSVSLLVAHNFGITSIEEGEIMSCSMKLKSTKLERMSFAKEPSVCHIERTYQLCGDELQVVIYMGTSTTPLTEHLRICYRKVE